jgi:hypothetical protein
MTMVFQQEFVCTVYSGTLAQIRVPEDPLHPFATRVDLLLREMKFLHQLKSQLKPIEKIHLGITHSYGLITVTNLDGDIASESD